MNYKELVDPELKKGVQSFPYNRFIISAGNIFQDLSWRRTKVPADIKEKTIETDGFGGMPLKISVFSPADSGNDLPALIYVHGGAFTYKAATYQKKLALLYAGQAGCKVFFPHYHLAPKYKYPAAYEDVLSACRYVADHASQLGVSKEQIGIAGDSAGASIAALICNRWEESRIPMPCLQLLVYPVTGAQTETESMKRFTDTPQWNSKNNERMWLYYCGDDRELRRSASPMCSSLPPAIPETYIEVTQYDCLHDEGLMYGEMLKQAGADVETNETQGTYHGYDAALEAEIVKQNISRRTAFLQRCFTISE